MMIIKIGGGKSINIPAIISDLAFVKEHFVVVHGANALRDELAEALQKPKRVLTSVSGYSSVYSDQDALDVMMMAYAGLKNKRIVELCQQNAINAVGLSGLDGRMVIGQRNRGIRIREGEKIKIVRDFSGKPKSVNVFFLRLLLANGFVPVLSVPILDEQGVAVNSENDDIIALLHRGLQASTILQFIEAPGYLKDPKDPNSLVPKITSAQLEKLEEAASGRIKRKLRGLRKTLENGKTQIIIADGRVDQPVQKALKGEGTVIS